jgi:hypothetical protein
MSPNPNSNINQPPNDGTRARANTVASVTPSSTIGSIASFNPFTPITPLDNDDVDDEQADTPDDAGHLATPHHPHPIPSSMAINRTLDIVDRVGDINEPKVPHQLAAAGQIESGGAVSSSPSVVAHGPLALSVHAGANDQTEGVHQSPDSDPFEYDDSVSTHSPVASPECSTHSDQVDDNIDASVAQQLPTSDQSYSDGTLPTNPTTDEPVEDDDPSAVRRSSTSDQHDYSTGNLTSHPTAAEFALDRFRPLVHAFAAISYPFTFDGDIVMPDDGRLKLFVCEKGHSASFKPQPKARKFKGQAKSEEAPSFDGSKE